MASSGYNFWKNRQSNNVVFEKFCTVILILRGYRTGAFDSKVKCLDKDNTRKCVGLDPVLNIVRTVSLTKCARF